MIRNVDLACVGCGWQKENVILDEAAEVACECCGNPAEQIWWKRPTAQNAQWDDSAAVLVLRGPDGSIRYPGQHNCRVPAGYERVFLRNLQEVNKFEREQGVTNHVMHYDNNGRAVDDYVGGVKTVH